jgi:ABC-2 type transport system ATP-binding protein
MIEFRNVTKLYRMVIGVNDLSLSLGPGAYGLLGPNGSGKTTLINLVMGQLRPTLGTVRLFGENPWINDSLLRRVGLCPAVQANFPFVTGREWVTYLVRLHGFSGPEAGRRAEDALELVGMTHAMNRAMNGYSMGMRQRTILAQAIAHDPELLILDEPFNGLDPQGRYEMTKFLQGWTKNGKSLILASHILHEVETLKPSLLLISGGRLLASGSPGQVRSILNGCPNSVIIQCRETRKLAALVAAEFDIDAIRVDTLDSTIQVETKSPLDLLSNMSRLATQHDLHVKQIRSTDESLQEIFSTLMRIHRGEVRSPG